MLFCAGLRVAFLLAAGGFGLAMLAAAQRIGIAANLVGCFGHAVAGTFWRLPFLSMATKTR